MKITAEYFEKATGRAPELDDLERSNCPDAGKPGHLCCGWDEEKDIPWFMSPNVGTRFMPAAMAKILKE